MNEHGIDGATREIAVYVHSQFLRRTLRERKYDYVAIVAQTSRKIQTMQMIKEFHASIRGTENFGLRADFSDAELSWEGNKVIYNPLTVYQNSAVHIKEEA